MTSNPGDEKVIQDRVHFKKGMRSSDGPNEQVNVNSIGEIQEEIDKRDARDLNLRITLPSDTVLTPDPSNLPVTLGQNVLIDGNNCHVDMTGVGKTLFEHDRSWTDETIPWDIGSGVYNLRVTGDETAGSQFLYAAQVPHLRLDRIWIDSLADGIELRDGVYFAHLSNININRCTNDGIYLGPGEMANKPNESRLLDVTVRKCTRGVVLDQVAGVTFNGNAETNANWDLLAIGTIGLDITGGFEGNVGGEADPHDRDGDGDSDPTILGLSPDPANHSECRGTSIHGTHFNIEDTGTAIVFGNVVGASVTGCNFQTSGSNTYAMEYHNYTRGLEFDSTNRFDNGVTTITKHINNTGSSITVPNRINNGVWSTEDFDTFEDIVHMSSFVSASVKRLTIEVTQGLTTNTSDPAAINGGDFPTGTQFVGVGKPTIAVEGSEDSAIRLSREGQAARNFTVDASATSGIGFGVYLQNPSTTAENIRVVGAGNDGVRLNSDSCEAKSVLVESANVSGDDIEVQGENCRVVSCDGAVLDNSTNGASTAANTDSL